MDRSNGQKCQAGCDRTIRNHFQPGTEFTQPSRSEIARSNNVALSHLPVVGRFPQAIDLAKYGSGGSRCKVLAQETGRIPATGVGCGPGMAESTVEIDCRQHRFSGLGHSTELSCARRFSQHRARVNRTILKLVSREAGFAGERFCCRHVSGTASTLRSGLAQLVLEFGHLSCFRTRLPLRHRARNPRGLGRLPPRRLWKLARQPTRMVGRRSLLCELHRSPDAGFGHSFYLAAQ
jgi:hypothetical protein